MDHPRTLWVRATFSEHGTRNLESQHKRRPLLPSKMERTHILSFMMAMVIILPVFFFVATIVQFYTLNAQVTEERTIDLPQFARVLPGQAPAPDDSAAISETNTISATLALLDLETRARLEAHVVAQRYEMAGLLLTSRLWTYYLGTVTGMILVAVGASFVLGKLREEVSEGGVEVAGWKATLKTSSPGLILAGLGVILMIVSLTIHHPIQVMDVATYFDRGQSMSPAGEYAAPTTSQPVGATVGNQ